MNKEMTTLVVTPKPKDSSQENINLIILTNQARLITSFGSDVTVDSAILNAHLRQKEDLLVEDWMSHFIADITSELIYANNRYTYVIKTVVKHEGNR